MAVTVNDRYLRASATAGQTVFNYDFPINETTDIEIQKVVSGTTVTTLVYGVDYTLTGLGVAAGGTFVLTTGATAGVIYVAYGVSPYARTTDFAGKAEITTAAINVQYDDLTKECQQNRRGVDRSVRFPLADTPTLTSQLPIASARANKYCYFDALGNVTTSAGTFTAGGITGPAISVDGDIALFNGTGGNQLKDSGSKWPTNTAHQGDVLQTSASGSLSYVTPTATNYIINGQFAYWDRGTTIVSPAGDAYLAEAWQFKSTGTALFTATKTTDLPTTAQTYGQPIASLKLNCTTAEPVLAADAFHGIKHHIEGYRWHNLVSHKFTLSFWVKATKTGIYSISFRNFNNTISYVTEYTVNASNTWEKKIVTIPDPRTNGGAWYAISGQEGMSVYFSMAGKAGTYSAPTLNSWLSGFYRYSANQVNGADTVGNDFIIAMVQLVVGENPVDYNMANDDPTLYRRYHEVIDGPIHGCVVNATIAYLAFPMYIKRSIPTITLLKTTLNWRSAATVGTDAGLSISGLIAASTTGYGGFVTGFTLGALAAGQPMTITDAAVFGASAEWPT